MITRLASLVLLLSSCYSFPASTERDDFTRTTAVTSSQQREPNSNTCVWTSIRAQRTDGEEPIYSLRFHCVGKTVLNAERILAADGSDVPFIRTGAGYSGGMWGSWEDAAAPVTRAWLEARAASGFTLRVYGRGYLDAMFRPVQIREVLDAADRKFGAPTADLPEFAGA